jgi:hypothetical protein
VIPYPWRTGNGKIQLKALGLQEAELLNLPLVLSLGLLLPPLGISRCIRQAMGSHLVSLVCLRKPTLEEGDL